MAGFADLIDCGGAVFSQAFQILISRLGSGYSYSLGYTYPMSSPERFSKIQKLLNKAGWRLVRVNGSHHIFKKADAQTISIPVHGGKVKAYYVDQVKKIIG